MSEGKIVDFKAKMKCPLCPDNRTIDINPLKVAEHLIVTIDDLGNSHIHGPLQNKPLIIEFIRLIAKEAGIKLEG